LAFLSFKQLNTCKHKFLLFNWACCSALGHVEIVIVSHIRYLHIINLYIRYLQNYQQVWRPWLAFSPTTHLATLDISPIKNTYKMYFFTNSKALLGFFPKPTTTTLNRFCFVERPLRAVIVRHRAPEGHREGEGANFLQWRHAHRSTHRPQIDVAAQRRHKRRQRSKRHLRQVKQTFLTNETSLKLLIPDDNKFSIFTAQLKGAK